MTAFRELLGGLVLICISAAFVILGSGYSLGTALRLGPGFLPLATASLLGLIGLIITVNALRAGITLPHARIRQAANSARAAIAILGSILAFSVTINRVGLLASSALVVVIASLAQPRGSLVRVVSFAIALSVGAAVIFVYGLGLPIPLYRWPG